MKHVTVSDFREHYFKLPEEMQTLADKNYKLLVENPRHPSLRFKKIKSLRVVRISSGYRALGYEEEDGNVLVWFWIGSHDEYIRILKKI